jgi:hypothetical protein
MKSTMNTLKKIIFALSLFCLSGQVSANRFEFVDDALLSAPHGIVSTVIRCLKDSDLTFGLSTVSGAFSSALKRDLTLETAYQARELAKVGNLRLAGSGGLAAAVISSTVGDAIIGYVSRNAIKGSYSALEFGVENLAKPILSKLGSTAWWMAKKALGLL